MENLTKYELKLIVRNRGIKDYQKMSRERLLNTLNKSMGLKGIAKIQNLSQNKLKQMTKMSNLLQNELKQIVKMRRIKDYKNMSKEELLLALLKSEQSQVDLYNNSEIEEARKMFNEIRNKLSKSEIKEIRKNLFEKEKGLENEEEQERRQHVEELETLKNLLEGLQEEI